MPGNQTIERMRRLLLAILTIGLVGTSVDLVLLKHYEDGWQIAPLVLLAAAVLEVVWLAWTGSRTAVAVLRVTMALSIVAGALGFVLHYQSNLEFQKEVDPSLTGWPLVMIVMRAKAPPALAPAAMIQLGLLGLLCTFRHPSLAPPETSKGAHA
ncbi:MAG TPA: hypothetical protein VH740_09315 [Vicinamibacterales bacterium]